MSNASPKYRFEAVPGYFMQDATETDPDTFDYVRQANHQPHQTLSHPNHI